MKQGLITEAEIDSSVKRLFLARFKLGMFDSPDRRCKWAQIPFSDRRSAGAPRARDAGRARVDGAAQERAATRCRSRRTLEDDRRDRPQRRSVADAARQLQRHARRIRSRRCAAFARRVPKHARALRARRPISPTDFPVLDVVPPSALQTPRRQARASTSSTSRRRAIERRAAVHARRDSTVDANWKDGAPRTGHERRRLRRAVDRHASRRRTTGTYRLGAHRHDEVRALPRRQPRSRARSIRRTTASFPIRACRRRDPMHARGRARAYRIRVDRAERRTATRELQMRLVGAARGARGEALRRSRSRPTPS